MVAYWRREDERPLWLVAPATPAQNHEIAVR